MTDVSLYRNQLFTTISLIYYKMLLC